MTSQPEPHWGWPGGAGNDQSVGAPGVVPPTRVVRAGPVRRGGGGAGRGPRVLASALLLAVGLAGLGVAAVGIAHRLLPRRFTATQQRQIMGWEMERRWRVLPADKIFPKSVSYTVPATALDGARSLVLQAQRLGISQQESCSAAVSTAAASVLEHGGCSAALRATYVDSSGSMVATVVVTVLPASSTASSVARALTTTANGGGGSAQTFPVTGTPAAGFADADRQLSDVDAAGPYVILSTAGFSDDRLGQVSADAYLRAEMTSLAAGLVNSARQVLGKEPPLPVCPGAPGC